MDINLEQAKAKAEIKKIEAETEKLLAEAASIRASVDLIREQARELYLENEATEKGS